MSRRKRIETDVMKLLMSNYEVRLVNDNVQELYITFCGPQNSPYENGTWKIHVDIPNDYPYKSPSIGFVNRIFHPNIDEKSGSVCLDVINQAWSPMFDILNVFESFLPQLLSYPNPTDPLNPAAAQLLLRSPSEFEKKVREHVSKHAMSASKNPKMQSNRSPNADSTSKAGLKNNGKNDGKDVGDSGNINYKENERNEEGEEDEKEEEEYDDLSSLGSCSSP